MVMMMVMIMMIMMVMMIIDNDEADNPRTKEGRK